MEMPIAKIIFSGGILHEAAAFSLLLLLLKCGTGGRLEDLLDALLEFGRTFQIGETAKII